MVIVKLRGGLGNQMFQYAAGKSLANYLGTTLKIDTAFLLNRAHKDAIVYRDYNLDIFSINPDVATEKEVQKFIKAPISHYHKFLHKVRNYISPHVYFEEPCYAFTSAFFNLPVNSYLDGYWQTPKYFRTVENEIRNDFRFRKAILNISSKLYDSIVNENSICINVRRTDFLANSFHRICDMEYFNRCVEIITSKVKKPHFFVFSDDLQWCVQNFRLSHPVTFVGHEHAGSKFSNYLQLMTLCKHYIIPNSSFAWWAAWLNTTNPNKIVIAPEIWFNDSDWHSKDLIPERWIKVAN